MKIYRWRLMIAICAERGRFAAYTYSRECASTGGAIYLAIISCQIYRHEMNCFKEQLRNSIYLLCIDMEVTRK